MLDTATASLGLMSQRAHGGLVRATAPHRASYFVSFAGQSQELSDHKLPLYTPSSAPLSRSDDFEADWPVIDSDFM